MAIILSCKPDENSTRLIDNKLKKIESRNKYLEDIYNSDQSLRNKFSSSNFNAQETHEFWKEAGKTDSINLIKIDSYLQQFGYPDTINYSEQANDAPWYVIQHCPKLKIRTKYYLLIKESYESGKISEIQFYLYLQRNYVFKYKEMLGIENDNQYTFKEKINILLDTLKYEL